MASVLKTHRLWSQAEVDWNPPLHVLVFSVYNRKRDAMGLSRSLNGMLY